MKVREGYYSEQLRNKSFSEILDILGERQKQVLLILKDYGPLSNEEIAHLLNIYPHQVCPRINELRKIELVEFAGETTSEISKKKVSLWKLKKLPDQLRLFWGYNETRNKRT